MGMSVLPECYICVPHAWLVHARSEEDTRTPETEATDDCDPPCECWELNLGLLKEPSAPNCWIISPNPFWIVKKKKYLGDGDKHFTPCMWWFQDNFGGVICSFPPPVWEIWLLVFIAACWQVSFQTGAGLSLPSPTKSAGIRGTCHSFLHCWTSSEDWTHIIRQAPLPSEPSL